MTVLLPAWLQAGQYNAEIDRSVATSILAPSGFTQARQGVIRWSGEEFRVVQSTPAALSVTVRPGMAWVQGAYSSTQGVYAVVNDEDVVLSIASTGAQPRIDLIILEVLDEVYSGSLSLARLRVITGTATASPVVPTVTGSVLVLGQVLVASNATSISAGAITDRRFFTAAVGGVIPVTNAAQRLLMTSVPAGTLVYEVDTRRYWGRTDSGWEYVAGGTTPAAAVTLSSGWANWQSIYDDGNPDYGDMRVWRQGGLVYLSGILANQNNFSARSLVFTLPAGYRPERTILTHIAVRSVRPTRIEIHPNGSVYAFPGQNGETSYVGDWWPMELSFHINNNTVG